MKKTLLLSLTMLLVSIEGLYSLQFASITWREFVQRSELFAEARIIKTEILNNENHFTFELLEVYKGPRVKSVTIVQNMMYDGPLAKTGDTCFIAMRKKGPAWVFATPGRSFWPITHEQTPNLKAIARVGIDDHLIRELPGLQKKRVLIHAWLLSGRVHAYEAEVYLRDDVRNFLKAEFK